MLQLEPLFPFARIDDPGPNRGRGAVDLDLAVGHEIDGGTSLRGGAGHDGEEPGSRGEAVKHGLVRSNIRSIIRSACPILRTGYTLASRGAQELLPARAAGIVVAP